MSIQQVSGPCFVYVARINSYPTVDAYVATNQLYFLGTCEQPPTIQLNPQWEPVMNDIGGSLLPIDYAYQGEDGLVTGVFNKWNEYVYRNLSSHSLSQGLTSRGTEILGVTAGAGGDIGKLAQVESISFHMWLHFPYSGKAIFGTTNFMPAGYHFYSCRLAAHVVSPGTRVNRRQLIVHCDRCLSESATASLNGFILYDNSMIATVDGAPPGSNIFPAAPPLGAQGLVSLG